jgi:hypothetical protein
MAIVQKGVLMPAHQCPRCELRFSFRTEVENHLDTDHRPMTRAPTKADAGSQAKLDERR